jgi:uncharacterized protein YceK
MRKLILSSAAVALLSGCALITAAKTGQPLDQNQVRADLANAAYLMQATGCSIAVAGAAAAPVISIAGDAEGNQVLQAVDAAGMVACKLVVPATALPVPAAPNAPAVSVSVGQ